MSNLFICVIIIFAVFSCSTEGRSSNYDNVGSQIQQVSVESDVLREEIPDTTESGQSYPKCGKCKGGKCIRNNINEEYCQCPPGKAWYFAAGFLKDISECRDCNCGKNQISCTFVDRPQNIEKNCICEAGYGDKSGTCTDCGCGYGFNCTFKVIGFISKKYEKTCICGKDYTEANGKCKAINPCDRNPCKNSGFCVKGIGLNYTCNCPMTHTGRNCDTAINPCDRNPCQNGGTCIKGTGLNYTCSCPSTNTGIKCEKRLKICTDQTCKNGGLCWENTNHTDYMCTCLSNHTGRNCERDMNGCDSNPCQNGGVCWSGKGLRYLCICPETHAGKNCERKIHVCDKKPCFNGGTCWRGNGSDHYCSCPEKFIGKYCEAVIDPCESKPCENGGTCWRGEDMEYLCICLAGYGGKNCDARKPISMSTMISEATSSPPWIDTQSL